jgi:hypothetical protein
MSIGAITGTSGVGAIQTDRSSVPSAAQGSTTLSAPQIPTGTYPPLTPAVLASLIGEQLTLYGSFN